MKVIRSLHVTKYDKETLRFFENRDDDTDFWIYLGEVELEFDMPPFPTDTELTNRQIAYLRKGREETVKEFSTKLANIDQQIEELLALPNLTGV